MILPPDYIGQLNNLGFLDVVLLMIKFNLVILIYMILNVVYMVGFVWWLLFICRFFGIPWIDGTTRGFVNRSKE